MKKEEKEGLPATKASIDSRYYVPEIGEFHPGFEFEYRPRIYLGVMAHMTLPITYEKEWKKAEFRKRLEDPDFPGELHFDDPAEMYIGDVVRAVENDAIRVKYLDEADILNLGGFPAGAPFEGSYAVDLNDDDFLISMYERNIVKISKTGKNWKIRDKVFEGVIKNKSELKRVLKQVGVMS